MAESTRNGWSFAAGLMVGGAAALWASFAWLLPAMGPLAGSAMSGQPPAASASQLVASDDAAKTSAKSGAAASASGQAACGLAPVIAPASGRDGRFNLDTAAEPASLRGYLAAARDAARQGRLRDSEVSLLAACRLAAGKWPLVSVPVADVQSQLGQRYLETAAAERDDGARAALLERAEGLLEKSLLAYTVVLGTDASKSRMAARRVALLAQLRERQDRLATAGADGTFIAPDASSLATLGAAPSTLWGGLMPPAAATPAPVQAAAALIQSDPELAQLDADVARLRAQAANVSRDPEGLRQRSERALAQRDAQCHDKPCLLRWYAQRKRELFAEF